MNENELANRVIGRAIEVHKILGPGLLENVYKESLFHLIKKDGLYIEKEKTMSVSFQEIKIESGYRIDLLVENKLLIELKSVDAINDIHLSQTLSYLKLGKFKLGLLINFNVPRLKEGIKRVANGIV
jgi:GxxExxY protein